MNQDDLVAVCNEVRAAYYERKTSGEFDANSKHIALLLESVLYLYEEVIHQNRDKKKK